MSAVTKQIIICFDFDFDFDFVLILTKAQLSVGKTRYTQ